MVQFSSRLCDVTTTWLSGPSHWKRTVDRRSKLFLTVESATRIAAILQTAKWGIKQ